MHGVYLSLLIVMCLTAEYRVTEQGIRHSFPLAVCAGVVLVNWIANTSYVLASGDTDPELVFLATDTLSVLIVVRYGQGLTATAPMMLLASYAGQIIMHVIHIGEEGEPLYYWQLLTMLGYGQLLLLTGWALAYREPGHESG